MFGRKNSKASKESRRKSGNAEAGMDMSTSSSKSNSSSSSQRNCSNSSSRNSK